MCDVDAGMYLDHEGHLHANNSNVRQKCSVLFVLPRIPCVPSVYCHSTHQETKCCRLLTFGATDNSDTREEGAELEAKAEGEVELIAAVSPAAVRLMASAGLGVCMAAA